MPFQINIQRPSTAATPKSHPTKSAIKVTPSPSPAVSPHRPIITHHFSPPHDRGTHDGLFLAYRCGKQRSLFQAKHTASDVGEMVSSMLPIPPRRTESHRVRVRFPNVAYSFVYFCPFIFFAPPFLSTLKSSRLAVGRHCSQKHSLVRTEVTFCTCDFGFIKEHLRAKRERSCQQQCLANAYRYFYGSPDRVSKNNTIYSDNAMQQPSVPVKTKRSARRQPPPGYHMLAATPPNPTSKIYSLCKSSACCWFFPVPSPRPPPMGGPPLSRHHLCMFCGLGIQWRVPYSSSQSGRRGTFHLTFGRTSGSANSGSTTSGAARSRSTTSGAARSGLATSGAAKLRSA